MLSQFLVLVHGDGMIDHHYNTTREQTLERCPNLALASVFFAAGTKGPFSSGS